MPEETTIEIDQPTPEDWEFEEVFGDVSGFKKIPFPKITLQNQGLQPLTKMACGQYALVHIINAQDRIVSAIHKKEWKELQAIDYWKQVLKTNPQAEQVGTTLQSNLELHRKNGNISGYAKVTTKEQVKQAIDLNQYIYTGSQTGNWVSVRDKKVYELRTDGKIVGHITAYGKYDNDYIYGINSYGDKNGIFKVSWDIFLNHYFTKYAVLDSTMTEAINQYRSRIGKQ